MLHSLTTLFMLYSVTAEKIQHDLTTSVLLKTSYHWGNLIHTSAYSSIVIVQITKSFWYFGFKSYENMLTVLLCVDSAAEL